MYGRLFNILLYETGGGGMLRMTTGNTYMAVLALLLVVSVGVVQAHALPYPGTVYMFYSDEHMPDDDIIDMLSSLIPNIPDIILYEVPSSDIDDILDWLDENSTNANSGYLDRAIDNGDFVLTYDANPNSEYEPTARQWLQDNELLDNEVEWLNENFRLPHDVSITAEECDEANAFYDPSTKEVIICYELIDELYDMWLRYNEGDYEGADNFVYDVATETLYHELGHAVIDIYNLPYTGKQENVADQFTALVLSYTYSDANHNVGQDMMYNVALNYKYYAQDEESNPDNVIHYWGVHGLNQQRMYNILCYAYGADPVYNADLLGDVLPEERADGCEEEYEHVERAFSHLLSYYTNGFFD